MKAVINSVLDSKIINDHCEEWKILIDNSCDCPEIFAIIFEDMNLIIGGTCRNNRIGLPGNYENLTFPRGEVRGTYRRIYNRLFHLVATIWKDSNTLQLIIILVLPE